MKRNGIIAAIRDDDPSYDPIPQALERAGIHEPVFRFAESYIFADGYYGPFCATDLFDEESAESRGLTPETVRLCDTRDKCLNILAAVASEIDDYVSLGYHEDEDGREIEVEEDRIDSRAIADDRFDYVRAIYGGSILSLSR